MKIKKHRIRVELSTEEAQSLRYLLEVTEQEGQDWGISTAFSEKLLDKLIRVMEGK